MDAEEITQKIAAIDRKYTDLCTQLGDLTVRKEQIQIDETNIRTSINQLRIDRSALNLELIQAPQSEFAPMTSVPNA